MGGGGGWGGEQGGCNFQGENEMLVPLLTVGGCGGSWPQMHNGLSDTTFIVQPPDLKPQTDDAHYLHRADRLTALPVPVLMQCTSLRNPLWGMPHTTSGHPAPAAQGRELGAGLPSCPKEKMTDHFLFRCSPKLTPSPPFTAQQHWGPPIRIPAPCMEMCGVLVREDKHTSAQQNPRQWYHRRLSALQ